MRNMLLLVLSSFLFINCALSQIKEIKGNISDAKDNLPVDGASIIAKGGKENSISDKDGSFTISVSAKIKELIISHIGYKDQTVPITGSGLKITLTQTDKSLAEIVVTGYGNKTQRSNTGSSAVVAVDEIRTSPVASFDQLLQGEAPGINVKSGSGQPGRNAEIVIRGRGSINGSIDPLYIVDGVEVRPEDFSTVN